jgi:hypothetical protein
MKKIVRQFFLCILATMSIAMVASERIEAHGGGLDSDGGHNCRVGSCAGTYHCHQPRGPACGGGGGYGGNGSNSTRNSDSGFGSTASCIALTDDELSRGEAMRLQMTLRVFGFTPGPIDGYFGPRTQKALRRYERKQRLAVSPKGSVNFATIVAMNIDC